MLPLLRHSFLIQYSYWLYDLKNGFSRADLTSSGPITAESNLINGNSMNFSYSFDEPIPSFVIHKNINIMTIKNFSNNMDMALQKASQKISHSGLILFL